MLSRDGDTVTRGTLSPNAVNCTGDGRYPETVSTFILPEVQKKSYSFKEQLEGHLGGLVG